ncbi:MAG: hypothetical protein ABWZ99_11040 [Ilumatobacteraceae bacterium]
MAESLADKIVAIHLALDGAGLPHAFGGALALAWCTERARGTIDIDVNVFVPAAEADTMLAALPPDVVCGTDDRARLLADGQTRLWWGSTPVDLFLDTTPFHTDVGRRVRTEPFAGHEVPFLSCRDLAVFKAFFDRTKDWADLEEMAAAGTLDIEAVAGVLVRFLGGDDQRIARLLSLDV